MNSIIHYANQRGHADHGWLNSYHSFSFANYYNPERMHFGVLRVLNDDTVAAGRGFNTHPHNNMEIISIPLYGDLKHEDSEGNTEVIKQGDVQVMSAGTGIYHSEYNANSDKEVRFLQIWIFPKVKNVAPRYQQLHFKPENRKNIFQQIISPNPDDQGLWIHQDAWMFMSKLDMDKELQYELKRPGLNGVYIFILEGEIRCNNQLLSKRDAIAISGVERLELKSLQNSEILLMEIPMH